MRDDPRQARLPLTREARFGALRRIDPATLGIGRRSWANVVNLLEQVELCGTRDGCHAYVSTLAARMAGGIGVSEATLHRARRAAVKAKLLLVDLRHDGRRQQSNAWAVDWSRVTLLAAPETDTPACRTDTPGLQTDTLYKGTTSTEASSQEASRQSTGDLSVAACDAAARAPLERPIGSASRPRPAERGPIADPDPIAAFRFGRTIGRATDPRHRVWAWKFTALAAVLGEHWLANISEAVRRTKPRKPWAVAWKTAWNGSRDCPGPGEDDLRRLLGRVSPPPEGWPASAKRRVDALSERQCVGGEP